MGQRTLGSTPRLATETQQCAFTVMPQPSLIGRRFGKLFVTGGAPKRWRKTYSYWICDCGATGCSDNTWIKFTIDPSCRSCSNRTHGQSLSKTYRIWQQILQRCLNPKSDAFKHYGGRGIKVCDRWLAWKNFLVDMGERPAGLSINRKDNNGPYCKQNCEWTTQAQQRRNSRSNIILTVRGVTGCMTDLCNHFNVSFQVARRRFRHGWSAEASLFTKGGSPVKGRPPQV